MLRRLLAAVILVAVAGILLVVAWPQLFGLQQAALVAQAVSLRGLCIAVSVVAIVALVLFMAMAPRARRFAASLAALVLVFILVTTAVLASRGFGNLAFETKSDNSLTVLSWNTLGDAPGAKAIAELALDSSADIVVLPETTKATGMAVADAMGLAGRPMQQFTIAFDVISKARSTTLLISTSLGEYEIDTKEPNSLVLPTVIARPVDGTGPEILGVHLVAPIPGELAHWRTDLAWAASACSGPNVIMAGDFNSTIDHFAGLGSSGSTTLGHCTDAASASDNAAVGTWPTALPALLSAPIDHVMATANWKVTGFRVIENYDKYGSDHRPVLAQLSPTKG